MSKSRRVLSRSDWDRVQRDIDNEVRRLRRQGVVFQTCDPVDSEPDLMRLVVRRGRLVDPV
jgi:hypothetical protein